MRHPISFTAAAPLALLAACGESTPVEETEVVPMENEVTELDIAGEALPEVPENALDEVDFSGTYIREAAGGLERLTLNTDDDTYEYVAPDGTQTSGSFARMEDNRRIALEDLDNETVYFSVAEGSIYRLSNAESPADLVSVASQYLREEAAPAEETEPESEAGQTAADPQPDQP